MDSYLSGRERVGEVSLPKEKTKLLPGAINELEKPEADPADVKEACGEGGSRVAYLTEDGRVTRIIVTCACGQVTEIDCNYEA